MTPNRVVLAGLAAVVVAVVGMVVWQTGSTGSSPASSASASGDLRATVVFPEASGARGESQLFVIEGPGGTARAVGGPAAYSLARFSPDGSRLAALAPAPSASKPAQLLITALDGQAAVREIPADRLVSTMTWSPSSGHVALVGLASYLYTRDGRLVAIQQVGSPLSEVASGGSMWSPDGTTFVAIVNGRLMSLSTDGTSGSESLGALPGGPGMPYLIGWVVGVGPVVESNGRRFTVKLGAPLEVRELGGELVVPHPGLSEDVQGFRVPAEAAVPGARLASSDVTSDRAAIVGELRAPNGQGTVVVVADDGRRLIMSAAELGQTFGGGLIDAVLARP